MRKREKVKTPLIKQTNSQKKNIKVIPKKIKATPESRLSDLEKTLDINIQILKTFYQSNDLSNKSNNKLNISKEQTILKAIENINNKYKKKKEIFNKIKQNKSKSLIELQIYSEKKRKLEELKNLYQDKIEENEEGLFNKEENIKKVEKRLKEVEIYIHKLTLNMQDKIRQKYYQDFTIRDFLEINNEIARQKDLMTKRNNQIKLELKNTLNENKLYKMKNSEEKKTNDESGNKMEEEKNEQEEKIKKLTQKYENKIELINSKKNLLKNALEKMNSEFHSFDINKIIKKNNQSINLNIDSKKGIYKAINPKRNNNKESTRKEVDKMNSFLDLSVINNKDDENNISNNKFDVLKSSIWDVSAINAKDISFIEKKEGI